MCEFCNGSGKQPLKNGLWVEIPKGSSELKVYAKETDGEPLASLPVKFCPMCTRKLDMLEDYSRLEEGTVVYYADTDNNRVEKCIVANAAYRDGELVSVVLEFPEDDNWVDVIEGEGFGEHYFLDWENAFARLQEGP